MCARYARLRTAHLRRPPFAHTMSSPSLSSPVSIVGAAGSYLIDALLGGMKWGGAQGTGAALTYSFPLAQGGTAIFSDSLFAPYSNMEEPGSAIHPFTPGQQGAATGALASWAAVANLSFTPMPDGASDVGDIRFAFSSVPRQDGWGWAYGPSSKPSGGDVWVNYGGVGSIEDAWMHGGVSYDGILHEIGHALGLKHPFSDGQTLPPAMEDMRYSVMSYVPAPGDIFFRTLTLPDGSKTSVIETIMPDTPMLLDVAAAQYLYGPNMAFHAYDDVYTFDPHQPFFRTLWDAGGTDTISVANFTEGCTIDLRAGHFSSITIHSDPLPPGSINFYQPTYNGHDNLAIAFGTTIENAVGGAGADTLIGNDADNVLAGAGGDDSIDGGGGIDTAPYSGPRAQYVVTWNGGALTVRDTLGGDGTDTMTNFEWLQFADTRVAVDADGHVATVQSVIAAVFGKGQVHNASYVGIGLHLLAAGDTIEQVMQYALDAALGPAASADAVIDLLYENITGAMPADPARDAVHAALDLHTQSLAGMAAAAAIGGGAVGAALVGVGPVLEPGFD
jgi:serralysin